MQQKRWHLLKQLNSTVARADAKLIQRRIVARRRLYILKECATSRIVAPSSLILSFVSGVSVAILKDRPQTDTVLGRPKYASSDTFTNLIKTITKVVISSAVTTLYTSKKVDDANETNID